MARPNRIGVIHGCHECPHCAISDPGTGLMLQWCRQLRRDVNPDRHEPTYGGDYAPPSDCPLPEAEEVSDDEWEAEERLWGRE